MCIWLVKLKTLVLNIARARRIWLQMCCGLHRKMEGPPRSHLVWFTLVAKSKFLSPICFSHNHSLTPLGFFLVISVWAPATRVWASEAGITQGKRVVRYFSCMTALSHKTITALHGHQPMVPNSCPAPWVGHVIWGHGWRMALGCSHIWSLFHPAPCCLPQAEYPSHKPWDIAVV